MMQVDRKAKYQQMRGLLNEKQWRPYLALEAKERGSVGAVAQEAGVSPNTIRRGIQEIEAGERYSPAGRERKAGAGRKKAIEKDTRCSDAIPNCDSSALLVLLMPPSKPSGVKEERHCDHTWNA